MLDRLRLTALDSGGFITASGDLLTAAGDLVLCGEQHNDVPMTQSSEHQEPVIDNASMFLYYSSDHSEPSLPNGGGDKGAFASRLLRLWHTRWTRATHRQRVSSGLVTRRLAHGKMPGI